MAGKLAKILTQANTKLKLIKLPAADYHLLDINFTNPTGADAVAKIYISDTEVVGDVSSVDLIDAGIAVKKFSAGVGAGSSGRTCIQASANEVVWIECDVAGVACRLTHLDHQP